MEAGYVGQVTLGQFNVTTLDALLQPYMALLADKVAVLKIDVEGHEAKVGGCVCGGGQGLLRKRLPASACLPACLPGLALALAASF